MTIFLMGILVLDRNKAIVLKQRAASLGNVTVSLESDATTYTVGQEFEVRVKINPNGNTISGIDLYFARTPQIEVTQITQDPSAFPHLILAKTGIDDEEGNVIRLVAVNTNPWEDLSGRRGEFLAAKIKLKGKTPVEAAYFRLFPVLTKIVGNIVNVKGEEATFSSAGGTATYKFIASQLTPTVTPTPAAAIVFAEPYQRCSNSLTNYGVNNIPFSEMIKIKTGGTKIKAATIKLSFSKLSENKIKFETSDNPNNEANPQNKTTFTVEDGFVTINRTWSTPVSGNNINVATVVFRTNGTHSNGLTAIRACESTGDCEATKEDNSKMSLSVDHPNRNLAEVYFGNQPCPSPTPTPTAGTCPRGDLGNLNCDGQGLINEGDLSILLRNWSPNGPVPTPAASHHSADIVVDNKVDEGDLSKLLHNWKTQ